MDQQRGVGLLGCESPFEAARATDDGYPIGDVVGQPVLVTFRLHGSLPAHWVFPPARLTTGKAFVAMDRILDAASSGPVLLARAEILRLVRNALKGGQSRFQRYQLHAFVLMPNHVHLLVACRGEFVSMRKPLADARGSVPILRSH